MNCWFVIPNLNGKKWLAECLGTLQAALPAGCTACVVDNGSTDGSAELLARDFPAVVVIPLAENHGFVGATNLGTERALAAGADAVVFLNNDTRGPREWVRELLAAAARHPEIGILGPRQVDFAGNLSGRTKAILKEAGDPQPTPEIVPAAWVEGSALLIRREVFARIGLLDELFAPAYFEEVDFCRRARRAGFGVAVAMNSTMEHHGAGTSAAGPAKRRQRILLERNYLLYFATDPARPPWLAFPALAARAIKHGFKAWRAGNLSLGEWAIAWRELAGRLPAAWVKIRRERRNWACTIPTESSPSSLPQVRSAGMAPAGAG